jgi:hypothetical protein
MADMQRESWKSKIRVAKEELKTAGPHHRRDLLKHIHRMQKELMIYDKYQQAAKTTRG